VDADILKAVAFLSAVVVIMLALGLTILKLRRRTRNIRSEVNRQRHDTLRAIRFMLRQMEYDAEVLRLLRHAKASKEKGDEVAFTGALDTLVQKEQGMLKKIDNIAEFEGYLKETYAGKKDALERGGPPGELRNRTKDGDVLADGPDGKGAEATPEQMKADIQKFIGDIERIRGGELELLEQKIIFFSRWVEGPERADIQKSLRAMEVFLDKGDTSKLEEVSAQKKKVKPVK
jgi:hypothetical protein